MEGPRPAGDGREGRVGGGARGHQDVRRPRDLRPVQPEVRRERQEGFRVAGKEINVIFPLEKRVCD